MRVIIVLLVLTVAGCYSDVSQNPTGYDEVKANLRLSQCLKEFAVQLPTDPMARCRMKMERTGICLKRMRDNGLLAFMTEDKYQEEYRRYSDKLATNEACLSFPKADAQEEDAYLDPSDSDDIPHVHTDDEDEDDEDDHYDYDEGDLKDKDKNSATSPKGQSQMALIGLLLVFAPHIL